MYNVVIVDDEPLVLHGVSAIVNSRNSSSWTTKTFQKGDLALEYCLNNPPDLLLTDINMPGMDGLTLIEELKLRHQGVKIVVLSCHEEFELVHKAFMLGADEYILKHNLDERIFLDILEALLPQVSRMNDPLKEGLKHSSFPSGSGTLGIIGFKNEYNADLECIPWAPDNEIIRQIIRNNLKDQSGDICFNGPWDEILLFISDDSKSPPEAKLQARRKFETIRTLLSGYINRKLFIALEKASGEDVHPAYVSAVRILEQKFYFPNSCLLFSDNMQSSSTRSLYPIFSLKGRNRLDGWKKELTACLNQGESLSLIPGILRSDISYAFHHLFYGLEKLIDDGKSIPFTFQTEKIYEGISLIDDREILQLWVERNLEKVYKNLQSFRERRTLSGSVREYVKTNFSDPLSLLDTASLFNVSPSYLSTCFKQEMGISYIKFVNRIRIGHACDLLAQTDFTVKEITYRTGYENPNYFSRLFKKQMGLTVSDYRKKIMDGETELDKQESEQ